MIVWVVTVGDQERNFGRKKDAVSWLVRLTHDDRPVPHVHREHAWRYSYYGGRGDLLFVTRAWIDKLGFPARRFYAPKKSKKRDAVDPSAAANTGNPTPRGAES